MACLSYLTGVATEPDQAGGVFVHRGHCRGVRLPEPPLALPLEHGLLWRGSLDEVPPPSVLALFRADLTWLSVGTRA